MKIPHAGAINQIAYVVPDIDVAVRWWAEVMGVGPFLALRDLEFETSDYKGRIAPSPILPPLPIPAISMSN